MCFGRRSRAESARHLIRVLASLVRLRGSRPPGEAPVCMDEANVDGLDDIDVSDLLYLVDYMFVNPPGPAPVACP